MTVPTGAVSIDDLALRRAAIFFAVAVALHTADHVRRGVAALPKDVFAAGIAAFVVEVALVVLVFRRHHSAPLGCAVGGLLLAAGYVEVHFLPAHSFLSDSFVSAIHTSPLSWAAASLEVIAALVLAGCGGLELRAGDG